MASNEPIAIVGSGCRFPGESTTPSKLWELLKEPRDVLSEIPSNRFNAANFYHPDGLHHGTTNVKHSYTLSEDYRHFDASFFGIKPIEADSIDPQRRLLLETIYEALEAAGMKMEALRGSDTAVYIGQFLSDYNDTMVRGDLDNIPTYFATGTSRAITSNHVSYYFDWHGPSMTVDTACSSSLVALHHAVQSLRSSECKMAVAGGVNLLLGPEYYIGAAKLTMLSPEGRSRMWDVDANGYGRGDGVSTVVLKTLSQALADGDHIECIIRGTGVNSDGRTKGITMPSEVAQTALIRETYTRAGLDLNRKEDRPQFFEAHGTGTAAGDPREAEAIRDAFFGPSQKHLADETLYVGSIKTLIGHTEGTAGLAGVLKASLALQKGVILPNMLFNRLNPAIEPYYGNLCIPTAPKQWPALSDGQPRRVSVNSFGFGGTNAHAILESYNPPSATIPRTLDLPANSDSLLPFIFSAATQASLATTIAAYSTYFKSNPLTNLRNLAYTLNSRRSALAVRASFSAQSIESLCSKLDAKLAEVKEKLDTTIGIRPFKQTPAILGIFTGQGAQWASMGKELILSSELARSCINELEASLAALPTTDRPSWSLRDEIMADAKSSRLSEAAICQPLCTAVQLVIVNLLHNLGVKFHTVVGHSSGEIVAAYTAGYLSATDALRIAYYRGFHAKLAGGPNGQQGAMMAVGSSLTEAEEFIKTQGFQGRICVAASNSSASVTLSGDIDAIEEAKAVLDKQKKFARLLKIDTAYHSHHMLRCADAYVKSLREAKVSVQRPSDTACTWYSSVHGGKRMDYGEELADLYWRDNMVNSVLFSHAVEGAMANKGAVGLALEVGPHPALKGPAQQTIQESTGESLPYSGLLMRGQNGADTFADALGFIWTRASDNAVDFQNAYLESRPTVLKDLPAYSWDHDQIFWSESRVAKAIRTREIKPHELLGNRLPDGIEQELRWRNLVRPKEVPWLADHQIQGKIVFPAAGYVSMALEAAAALAKESSVKLVEILDLSIGKPLAFDNENSSAETLFTLSNIASKLRKEIVTADFTCYTSTDNESASLVLVATGRVQVLLGEKFALTLPLQPPPASGMHHVHSDTFYDSLAERGYQYAGPFRTISSLKRRLNAATGLLLNCPRADSSNISIHPATLESAFQAAILAYCAPGDADLWSFHVPRVIRRISVNSFFCGEQPDSEAQLPFTCQLDISSKNSIQGDVSILAQDGSHTWVQIEGLSLVPSSFASPLDDRILFAQTLWNVATPNAQMALNFSVPVDLVQACERIAYYYLKKVDAMTIPENMDVSLSPENRQLLQYAEEAVTLNSKGKHPFAKREWNNDTETQILEILSQYPKSAHLKFLRAAGEALPISIFGSSKIRDLVRNSSWSKSPLQAPVPAMYVNVLGPLVGQVAHRYGHMNILEIDSGNGQATNAILQQIGHCFSSYTHANTSSEVNESHNHLRDCASKIQSKTVDLEQDLAEQGLSSNSYDVVILSSPLHVTSRVHQKLGTIRQLLRPGGHLLVVNPTTSKQFRFVLALGSQPYYWTSNLSLAQWNSALRKSGFSGIDSIASDAEDFLSQPFSVFASQAINDQILFLRQPLLTAGREIQELAIIGGQTLQTSKVANDTEALLNRHCNAITTIDKLEDTHEIGSSTLNTVLCLAELDEPIFKTMTSEKMQGLKDLFKKATAILWVTQGARDEAFAQMTIGFARSLRLEFPHLRLQILDVGRSEKPNATLIAEVLLRLKITCDWDRNGLHQDILWTTEPELAVEEGALLVPRMVPSKTANNRYNSVRRPITTEVAPATSNVRIISSGSSHILEEVPKPFASRIMSGDLTAIRVEHSILSSLQITAATRLFLVLGANVESGEKVLALAESNSSLIRVPSNRFVPATVTPEREGQYLSSVAGFLLANYLLSTTSTRGTLLVHQPSLNLAASISRLASEQGKRVYFTTEDDGPYSQWITLHLYTPERQLKALLPDDVCVFLDFSADEGRENTLGSRIRACISPVCTFLNYQIFLGTDSLMRPDSSCDSLLDLLRDASKRSTSTAFAVHWSKMALPDIPKTPIVDPLTVIDWDTTPTALIKINPVDPAHMFAKDKTYLLLGLTGRIGKSICEHMIANGAKHIVLTSRRPRIDNAWLQSCEASGATVKVFANDVTDEADVQQLYHIISETLPPIAGVVNGEMALHSAPFSEMTMKSMQSVLDPKVAGSRHLDTIFSANHPLDFFVMVSFLAPAAGSLGQTGYGAANSYLVGLASERRKRGLAASALVIDVMGPTLSERDVHTIFAEAVLASRSDSEQSSELITGFKIVRPTDEMKPHWFNNPKFQYWVQDEEQGGAKAPNNATSAATLLLANSKQDVYGTLKELFFAQLEIMLHITPTPTPELLATGADELGIDSLIAVEVRSWFMKTLQVDIPALRILGGATVGELLEDAVEKLPPSLTPNLENTTPSSVPSGRSDESNKYQGCQTPVPAGLSVVSVKSDISTSGSTAITTPTSSSLSGTSTPSATISTKPLAPSTRGPLARREKMSLGQTRFWFLRSYLEDRTTSNVTCSYRMTGEVCMPDLARAVEAVGQRHEALRTCFFVDENEQAVQGLLETATLYLEQKQITSEKDLASETKQMLNHVFDLERGESMKIALLSLSSSSHFLLISYHHINMDGISLQVLLSDLQKAYTRQPFSENMVQFPDFTARQTREIEDGKLDKELDFWRKEYPDIPPALPLFPMSRVNNRSMLKNYSLNIVIVRLPTTLATQIRKASREARATTFHFYLAVMKTLLHRFLATDDVCIGIADANRNDFDTMEAIGMYLNLLPLRFRSKTTETFKEAIVDTKAKAYAALSHSRLPFDILLDKLDVPRSASHSPLFQAFIDYRQGAQETLPFGDCKLDDLKLESGRTAYDISLDITEDAKAEPIIKLKTQSSLYSQEDTQILTNSYVNLLEAYASNPDLLLASPSLFNQADIQKGIIAGRGPYMESDWAPTLPHRIDEMIEAYPTRLAVQDGVGHTLTYTQFGQRVSDIARALVGAGAEEGSRVAVFQHPTANWVCCLLAIMRIGAIYVPLDLRNPLERLAAIVKAAQPSAILAHAPTVTLTPGLGGTKATIIDVSSIAMPPVSASLERIVPNRARADSPAVLQFTSGTTGTPKGMILLHASLRNEMEGYTKTWKVDSEIVLQQSAFSFDFSMDQMFSALSTGSQLYVVPKDKRGDPTEIAKIVLTEGITYTKATPSEYSSWVRYGSADLAKATHWKKAFAGGESLTDNQRQAFRSLNLPELKLNNSYGPGEISISSHKIAVPYDAGASSSSVPIPAGKCLPNYSVVIVDKNLQPVPIGVPGEVLIGGAGPARGYLNNEELTKQKFITNLYAPPEYITKGWTTAYRSGDRGRLRADGALLFDGRIDGDSQIKLRGLRIELEDIESSITKSSNGALIDGIVSVRGDPEFLVAHVVFANDFAGDQEAFLKKLRSQLPLPQYMCPAMIIPIERMPLTPHLKIDRRAVKAFPLPDSTTSVEDDSERELSDTESQLLDLWKTVISAEAAKAFAIDASTDFFHVGGSSMLLPKLQAKVRISLGVVLPLSTFFETSTLGDMAAKIRETASSNTIDWATETSVAELALEARELQLPDNISKATGGKTVLLTGSTGFLGRAILKQLVADEGVAQIHCVSVRPNADGSQRRLIVESDKIVIHSGDMTSPHLGLPEEEFATLAASVDMIIHSGAMRAFFEYYQLARKTNTTSTRELIKMALPRKIPIQFVSSGGLLTLSGGSVSTKSSVAHLTPPTDGTEGYLCSKWASEVSLENAVTQFGLPIRIHRGLKVPGKNDETQLQNINKSLLEMTETMNLLPDLAGWIGDLDFVPTATVVNGLCRHFAEEIEPNPSFEHYPGLVKLDVPEMTHWLEKQVDVEKFGRLNVLKWLGRIKNLGFEHVIAAQYLALEGEGVEGAVSRR